MAVTRLRTAVARKPVPSHSTAAPLICLVYLRVISVVACRALGCIVAVAWLSTTEMLQNFS
jgi:hypothetical protein